MKHPLGNYQQQIVAHSNPDLRVDSIARCSIERLDVQTSFYEFEERVHVPTFTVKFCDGENEMTAGKLTLKNMETGEQQLLTVEEVIDKVKG